MDRKKRIDLLAADLVRSHSQDVLAVRELLTLLVEDTKDSLVMSTGDDTVRAQGVAQALIKLRRLVSEAPMRIKAEGASK